MMKLYRLLPLLALALALPPALLLLPSCALARPFVAPPGAPVPDAPVTVVVTHAVLDNERRDVFDDYTRRLIARLDAGDYAGLVGYSVRQEPLGDEVWTLTVWTDADAMRRFARSGPHREAMRKADSAILELNTRVFELPPDALPPSWDMALQRLAEPQAEVRTP